jgi:Na+/proline symporter
MLITGGIAFAGLPEQISFADTFSLAGEMGKMNLVNLSFDPSDRYNLWSGLIGGLFLFLAYFGTDQSQVGRYLSGSNIRESRMGLLFNGLLKIPMQFIILYIGILVFMFYQFHQAPVFHNTTLKEKAMKTEYAADITKLEAEYSQVYAVKKEAVEKLAASVKANDAAGTEKWKGQISEIRDHEAAVRGSVKEAIGKAVPGANLLDRDYVFINFVMTYLPHGLIGLLLAVVFSAAMSSTASELNALASTTTVDIYKRSVFKTGNEMHYVKSSKLFTAVWIFFAMGFASLANQAENLIQFVNIVGSLFYGTILGIFLSAFYIKYIKSNAVFAGGILAELLILYLYFFRRDDVAFLLYNIIGCVAVVVFALVYQAVENIRNENSVRR